MVNIHVIGMSHIDLGFTVTEKELEELLEIFVERMLGVLDRHPEICYAIEQMAHYKKLGERRPDLLDRVKTYIQMRRIDLMGAMASSMETNFPNGECFVRNQQLGLRWAEEHLGVLPESAWLVDTFGLNPQIPQIYRQFGFQELFANRFGGDKSPEVFYAQGIDGSKLLVIGRDLASPNVSSHALAFRLCRSWVDTETLFQQADRLTGAVPRLVTNYIENEEVLSLRYMALTKERTDRADENWILSSYHQYIEDLRKNPEPYPVLSGDLNPEFTGTFSLRTPLKVQNRKVETQLLEAEKWASLLLPGYDPDCFDEGWWEMAFIQFHDVFSGSHGDATYHSVLEKFDRISKSSSRILKQSCLASSQRSKTAFSCFNGLPWDREEWIPIPHKYRTQQIIQNGEKVPSVWRDGERYCRITLPSVGAATLETREGITPSSAEKMDCCQIGNEFLRLSFEKSSGGISILLADGTEIIKDMGNLLTVQEDIGGFQIESPKGSEIPASAGVYEVSLVQKDAMGERMVIAGEFPHMDWNSGQNSLKWSIDFQVNHGENALRIGISVDWFGEGTRIRLNIPTEVRASDAVYEVPFGAVERTAYALRGTAKGEWPAHRFVALEDREKGIALVNRGVAGVESAGRTLSTTLIRAYYPGPMSWVPPTPETSQHGKHTYDFMLIPYKGSWKDAGVVRQAQVFNNPVKVFEDCRVVSNGVSFIRFDCENIVLSAVKNAADHSGDLIIRFYETFGEETAAAITVLDAVSTVLSDLRESSGEGLPCKDGRIPICCKPFEIQTIRVKRPL